MIKISKLTQQKPIKNQKGLRPVDFENQVKQLISKIKNRAEFEIKDNDSYRAINEYFQNSNKKYNCRAIAMTISQDEADKTQHILEISMLHPTMAIENKRPLAMGDKKAIINYLEKLNEKELIKTDITTMSEKLKNI